MHENTVEFQLAHPSHFRWAIECLEKGTVLHMENRQWLIVRVSKLSYTLQEIVYAQPKR